MKKLALHWWILIAMAFGVGYGVVSAQLGGTAHVVAYIKPFGTVFLNLLRMIAVPLVLFSLVAGVASLNDTSKMGRIGGKSIALYLGTTAIAITIGLLVVNIIQPGTGMPAELAERLRDNQASAASDKIDAAQSVSVLDQLINIVPTNPFGALAESKMLQIVFFALLLGIALTRLNHRKNTAHVVQVFELLSDAIIEMVNLIMKIAPIGVFALMASVIADLGENPDEMGELLGALAWYMAAVVIGLFAHLILVYGTLLKFVAKVPFRKFMKALVPAQLLAFSSSSSAATLPVTMDRVEKGVGVDDEVTSFVLPLGATINMDGTGLYQGVAAVFIANVYGIDLSIGAQLTIVLTAALASIGTAAVPGVGIVMLTIVLQQLDIPLDGIALILGVDRPLDMCRTVLNVTGDATVATVVGASEGLINPPAEDEAA